ncbi:metallophosphoesterase family protein [Pseudomonas marginalis]|uniref:metallophosphoesterase family protein n=1 Tax=Pseudomonas marginalis TaxID=298 RepID=UPI0011B5D240|nr:metallophosphoesterase [Pseudomonas marginalis]TWR72949.1 hypothetical protein FIV40_05550 [Pseudomonas marginalis]
MTSSTFSWLHISDFHAGMSGAKNLWIQVKERFHQDIRQHFEKNGSIDLVVFSGDITQKADPSEFQQAFDELSELWELFSSLGASPKLFIIPGNHDLTRPKGDSTLLTALDAWRKRASNIQSLLAREDHSYRKELLEAFSNYLIFVAKLRLSNIPILMDSVGAIPGDCSGVLRVNGITIGLIGLNTAWSQLEQEKEEGHLEFSADQIHKVVPQEITKWTASNNLNLLVTHHPLSWLTKDAQEEFVNEVNPLGRFDAHLFGHMHEHRAVGQEYSQKSHKKDFQVASLFGLEKAANGKIDRAHGYYFAKVNVENEELLIWPRKAESVIGGGWRIHPDRFSLPEGGEHNSHSLKVKGLSDCSSKKKVTEDIVETLSDVLAFHSVKHLHILARLRHALPNFQTFMPLGSGKYNVESAVANLHKERICWIVSSWDMAGDDFLSCIENDLAEGKRTWYRLSVLDYTGQEAFAQLLDREFGFSIIDLCNLLTNKDDAVLLLDDAPCETLISGKTGVEELISLAKTILEYCDKLKVVIRTTTRLEQCELVPVVLEAMDEADFNQYLLTHPDGKQISVSGLRPEDLFNLTKGEPAAIKRALNQLRFARAEDINFEDSANTIAAARNNISEAPDSLKMVVERLRNATQDRSYSLLQCLTVFPNGEDISNIRNFDPDFPYFPAMAEKLFELGLVEAVRFSVFQNESIALPKVVVAKRSVQEHIWGILTEDEIESATTKAVSLYFGRDWMLGKFKLSTEFKFDTYNHSSYAIQNAAILLRRIVNDALSCGEPRAIHNCLALLNFYTAKLDSASQYRYVCDACYNLIPKLIAYGYIPVVQGIVYKYARSLRMLGDKLPAIQFFQNILSSDAIEKSFKGRVLVDLALCYSETNEKVDALVTAKKVLALKERQSSYYHAKTIVISLGGELNRLAKLRALEKLCRNKKHFIAANNIAVQIIAEFESESGRKELYKAVAMRAKSDNDNYNFIKATISHAAIAVKQGDALPSKEIHNLIVGYHYVCSQRISSLFNQAHDCLWLEFERLGEVTNLVTLFKHSSLLFRLTADEVRERRYLLRIINNNILPLQVVLSMVSESDRIYIVNRMLRLGLATLKDASPEAQLRILNGG